MSDEILFQNLRYYFPLKNENKQVLSMIKNRNKIGIWFYFKIY